jgi:G3E family GTPase
VPTLLLTGFLGAGKTTLLRGWLAERPPGERWAVLVNEFGALGVDRALLGGGDTAAGAPAPVAVAEVAGGCACCAARVAFGATLTRLLRRGPWDRLFVETSGLGHPAGLVDALRGHGFGDRLRPLPPVAVVDATRPAVYADPSRPGFRTALDQVTLARLLVLNRASAVAPADARALADRLGGSPPWPRTVLSTATGTVPLADVLAALDEDAPPAARAAPIRSPLPAPPPAPDDPSAPAPSDPPRPMRWHRADAGASARGWWWPGTVVFDRSRLQAALEGLAHAGGPLRACGLLRAKGVFRTPRAWYAWQWVDDRSDWQETAWRADSRFEVLAEKEIDPDMIENALRAAGWKG